MKRQFAVKCRMKLPLIYGRSKTHTPVCLRQRVAAILAVLQDRRIHANKQVFQLIILCIYLYVADRQVQGRLRLFTARLVLILCCICRPQLTYACANVTRLSKLAWLYTIIMAIMALNKLDCESACDDVVAYMMRQFPCIVARFTLTFHRYSAQQLPHSLRKQQTKRVFHCLSALFR